MIIYAIRLDVVTSFRAAPRAINRDRAESKFNNN